MSLKFINSLQIFVNSKLLIVTTLEYSVSGIPNYSYSTVSKFKSKSANLSPLGSSNFMCKIYGLFSQDMKIASSL